MHAAAVSLKMGTIQIRLYSVKTNDSFIAMFLPSLALVSDALDVYDHVLAEFSLCLTFLMYMSSTSYPDKPWKESDEGSSPSRPSVFENGNQDTSLLDAVSRTLEEPKEKSSETWSVISRLTAEKTPAMPAAKSEASA
ncbi:hypothetical protein H0E87_024167 [Populus deltoides]|uniref:Uncharacterized protein n=1 Tax=Populus deltoides TaxID=3696 RepID=A0A8T2X6K9_POPDE|nr:hypothetical protein H0E87_024167 [Populus deltoides]